MSHLAIRQLSKSFGAFTALKDISLEIEAGEFICLLGGSGCGKTTLLRLIAGLEAHDRGEILLGGEDLTAVPCHKRNIGMVFQALALFPHLNVGENVAYGLRLRGRKPAEYAADVERLLNMVGLDGLSGRAVSALSGGQRQRVAIARALALSPSIFLMDEPFSALDAALRDQMQIEVKRIQRNLGVTTIFVTHDQREAMALADRIVVMNGGVIEQAGSPEALYARPATRFVAEFIGDNNILDFDAASGRLTLGAASVDAPGETQAMLAGAKAVAIRPEAVIATPKSEGGLMGRVAAVRRLGAILERDIDVGGKVIRQSVFAGRGPTISEGEDVALSWDWSQVWGLSR
ncbi:MAG: ABC transporter ATP-binding protein [Pseudomonadota bacterium]